MEKNDNSLKSEITRLKCEKVGHNLLVCFICTAKDCKSRFLCPKCLILEGEHNKLHNTFFKEISTFFNEFEKKKDINLAFVEDDSSELKKKKMEVQKSLKEFEMKRMTIEKNLSELSTKFLGECEANLFNGFKQFKNSFDQSIKKFLNQKISSFKLYEEELEEELIRLDVTSNKINVKDAFMRSNSIGNNKKEDKKDFKRLQSKKSLTQEEYLHSLVENLIFSGEGKKRCNDLFNNELENNKNLSKHKYVYNFIFMCLDLHKNYKEYFEKNIFLNIKNEVDSFISRCKVITEEIGKVDI